MVDEEGAVATDAGKRKHRERVRNKRNGDDVHDDNGSKEIGDDHDSVTKIDVHFSRAVPLAHTQADALAYSLAVSSSFLFGSCSHSRSHSRSCVPRCCVRLEHRCRARIGRVMTGLGALSETEDTGWGEQREGAGGGGSVDGREGCRPISEI